MANRWSDADVAFMRGAIALSRRGFPAPNPHVGAVVVRDGQVVGSGCHAFAGGPHAEAIALRRAGPAARGATLYVSLEPCAHHGRTGPCTDAILAARIARVVVATEDPNPLVNGKGLAALRSAGVTVEVGLLRDEAEAVNRQFLHFHRTGRPWVSIKAAMSLDGKIATSSGDSKWITGESARRHGHRLRAKHGAVLIGSATALADDPLLTARLPGVRNRPLRVLLDSCLAVPRTARLYNSDAPTAVFCTTGFQPVAPPHRIETVPHGPAGVSLPHVLAKLAEWGVTGVLVEGGGTVIASFLEQGLVDYAYLFYAPVLLGGASAKTGVEGAGVATAADAWRLRSPRIRSFGPDWLIEGAVTR